MLRAHTETKLITSEIRSHDDFLVSTFSQNPDDAIYEERVQFMRKACQVMAQKNESTNPVSTSLLQLSKRTETSFFVSVPHKLVYCSVQKIGSSFWKRLFRILNGMKPPGSLFHQSGLKSHFGNENITFENKSPHWQRNQLDRSLKFLFVRDPFARTFSAYMDKIFLPFDAIGRIDIFNEPDSVKDSGFGQNAGDRTRCRFKSLTFAKFIHAETSKSETLFAKDGHFIPIHTHCNPCAVPFDVVGKMESFQQDTEYILIKVGLKLNDFVDDPMTFDAQSDLNIMMDIVLRTLVSPAWNQLNETGCLSSRHELLQKMWTLFHVRGLISTSVSYPLSREQSSRATFPGLLRAVKDGYDASGDRTQRLWQREAAMMEAFRSVPKDDLYNLQAIHQQDCALFGYDCSVDRFLPAENRALSDHSFFKDWM